MSCFKNKVVVITGSGIGIGRALAQQCAVRGAHPSLSLRKTDIAILLCARNFIRYQI
jgi:NAD(P)-dependent dehydrogenase (short-subunit alcohol dehydrogenase family)